MGELRRGRAVCKDAAGRWDLRGLNQRHCWCTEPDKRETAEAAACLTVLKWAQSCQPRSLRPLWLLTCSPPCTCCAWTSTHGVPRQFRWDEKNLNWLPRPRTKFIVWNKLIPHLRLLWGVLKTVHVPMQLCHITVSSCPGHQPGALTCLARSLKGLVKLGYWLFCWNGGQPSVLNLSLEMWVIWRSNSLVRFWS